MSDAESDLADVAAVAKDLADLGLQPVLVGGMALVIIGSRRVTVDFDFVIAHPQERLERVVNGFYDRGFELAAVVDEAGDITATIGSRRVAAIRLRIDAPASAYFINPSTRLRIDLLFDFPLPAATLAERAVQTKIRSHVLPVASEADLLQLKKIARAKRSFAGDAEDIAFLEARHTRRDRRETQSTGWRTT